ncbi:MAG: hypothetical protein ACYCX5_04820 [Coriobacteriia bacterium]
MDIKRIIRGALGLLSVAALVFPPASAIAAGGIATRHATALPAENNSVFPATIVVDGRELARTRVVWSRAKQTGRKSSYAITYSFGSQVQGVKAPSTVRALYYDRNTSTNVLARLSLIRQISQPSTPATETERFFHVSTYPDVYPLFAGARLPYSSDAPTFTGEGVSDALLASMYYDSSVYSVVASRWDGPQTSNADGYGRWAVYTLRRAGTSNSAIYGGDVSLPDVRVYNGTAYYSDDATAVAAAHEASSTTTTTPPPTKPADKPDQRPSRIWPLVVAAAAALAAAGMVAFWYKRRKKRAVDGEFDDIDPVGDEDFDSEGESTDE